MIDQFSRTEMLLGEDCMKKIMSSRVAVFGIGGVGGYVAEALVRSGLGEIDIIDKDRVSLTNLNRQIIATHKTIGEYKVDVAEKRLLDINPRLKINAYKTFFNSDTSSEFNFADYDFVVDAIDTVSGKIELVLKANEASVPIISAMGAGNKLDILKFRVTDIYQTSVCPLARVMRKELKKRGIKKLKVVCSDEKPIALKSVNSCDCLSSKPVPGSTAFVPCAVGLIIAGEVIKDLCKIG